MNRYIFLLVASLTLNNVAAVPQRSNRQTIDNPDIQRQIDEVFNTPRTTPSRRGPGTIVTPDPNFVPDPTTSPQVLTKDEQSCTCVPYHMCDPNTNRVKNEPKDVDEVTGFGIIDIRFDPEDCQEVLDVCCVGEARRTDSIQPVVDTQKPTPNVAGCGIRNVGGLDFEITGAFVSTFSIVSSPSL